MRSLITAKKIVAIAVALLIGLTFSAKADSRISINTKSLMGLFQEEQILKSNSNRGRLEKIPALSLGVYVPGFGHVDAVFTKKQNQTWKSFMTVGRKLVIDSSSVLLLRGKANLRHQQDSRPIAASLYQIGDKYLFKARINGKRNPSRSSLQFVEIRSILNSDGKILSTKTKRALDIIMRNRICQLEGAGDISQSSDSTPPTLAATQNRILEVSTEADYQWFQSYGSSSNTEIASIVNAADTIYERDLGISISIKTQNVISSSSNPYSSSVADTLLTQFRANINSNGYLGSADAYHLFTGKDLSGDTIGLAYLGVVCDLPTYSYGLSQDVNSLINYTTFAHELAHNLNASHDGGSPPTIMYPSVANDMEVRFSNFSINEIANYISQYATACLPLDSSGGTPTPTPNPSATATPTPGGGGGGGSGADPGTDPDFPTLTLSGSFNKNGNFAANILASGGSPSSSCTLSFLVAKKNSFESTSRVDLASGDYEQIQITLKFPFGIKTTKSSPKWAKKVYMKALYTCPDNSSASYSNQLTVNTGKVTKKIVSRGTWVKRFAATLTAAAAQ